MGIDSVRNLMLCLLLLASPTESSLIPFPESVGPEILVERIKRVSRDEVHFSLKVTNRSDRPVFLLGIDRKSEPSLHPVHLEQWQPKDGWKSSNCMDMPPPHVIKLDPGEAITKEFWLQLPMSVVCRNPITRLEGKFRFRVEYFESEKQARAYVEKLFSRRWKDARAAVAVSEPFEIPPPASP